MTFKGHFNAIHSMILWLTPTLQWLGLLGPQSPQILANVSKLGCCRYAQQGLATTGWTELAHLPNSATPNICWSYWRGMQHLELVLQFRKKGHSHPTPQRTATKKLSPFTCKDEPHLCDVSWLKSLQACRYPCGLQNRNSYQADRRKTPIQTLKVSYSRSVSARAKWIEL